MMDKFKSFSPGLQKWLKIFFIACIVLTGLDIWVHKHGDYAWNFFGFFSLYGFGACVILVLIATWMRKPLMRSEDYYQPEGGAESDRGDSGRDVGGDAND